MTTPKWNTIIADDAPADRQILKDILKDACPQVNVLAEVSDVAETIACIRTRGVDLVFCNVSLRDGDVFEVIDRLSGFKGHFIILAQDEGFALRAFRSRAFDYLLKPISTETVLDVIRRLEIDLLKLNPPREDQDRNFQKQKFGAILLNAAGLQHVIQITDIIHLEGDGNYTTVHIDNGDKILVSKPLKHFEDILPAKSFYRVHQSHIINFSFVKSVQNGDVHLINLSNGNAVPLARRKKDLFLMWLSQV